MASSKRKHRETVEDQPESLQKPTKRGKTSESKAAKALRKQARAEKRERRARRRQAREEKQKRKEERSRIRKAKEQKSEARKRRKSFDERTVTVQRGSAHGGLSDIASLDPNESNEGSATRPQAVESSQSKSTSSAIVPPSQKKRGRPRKVKEDHAALPDEQPDSNKEVRSARLQEGAAGMNVAGSSSNLRQSVPRDNDRSGGRDEDNTPIARHVRARPDKAKRKAKFLADTIGVSNETLLIERLLDWDQLRWLAESRGLKYRTGAFTSWEDDRINEVLQTYQDEMDLDDAAFMLFLYGKREKAQADTYAEMWRKATAAVPGRPNRAVRGRVRRLRTPQTHKGAWTQHEEDMLAISVDRFGNDWSRIAPHVGRSNEDCRLRWRDQQEKQDGQAESWTKEESQALADAVAEYTIPPEPDQPSAHVDWTKVCAALNNRRTRIQCVSKWRLLKEVVEPGAYGSTAHWKSRQHSLEFIRRIKLQERALRKDDLKEVDMDKVVEGWHKWSPRILRYRWRMLYDTFVRDLNGGDGEVDYDRNLKANLRTIERGLNGLLVGRSLNRSKPQQDLIDSDEEV